MKRVEVSVHNRESNLYQQELEQYISTYLAQGYTPQQLEDYLVGKGYSKQSVLQALSYVNNTYHNGELEIHKPSSSMHTLLFLSLFLVILSVAVFVFVHFSTPYELYITLHHDEIQVGEPLQLTIVTTKTIEMKTIVSTNDKKLVLQQNDIIDSSKDYTIVLPSDLSPGAYVVDFNIVYKEETELKSFSFTVKEKVNQNNPADVTSPRTPSALVTKENPLQKFSKAIKTLDAHQCQKITLASIRDECYFVIARDSKNEKICESIEDSEKQERCYLTQILGGKTITCTILNEPENRAICETIS